MPRPACMRASVSWRYASIDSALSSPPALCPTLPPNTCAWIEAHAMTPLLNIVAMAAALRGSCHNLKVAHVSAINSRNKSRTPNNGHSLFSPHLSSAASYLSVCSHRTAAVNAAARGAHLVENVASTVADGSVARPSPVGPSSGIRSCIRLSHLCDPGTLCERLPCGVLGDCQIHIEIGQNASWIQPQRVENCASVTSRRRCRYLSKVRRVSAVSTESRWALCRSSLQWLCSHPPTLRSRRTYSEWERSRSCAMW